MTTEEFISTHLTDDPRRLALRRDRFPGVDFAFALDQIAGWQRARTKLPQWAATRGVVFPPHLALEQCSSEATARYKAAVVERLGGLGCLGAGAGERTLVDLTGGYGVDFAYLAPAFGRAVYVERQELLCRIARHNMGLLGLGRAEIRHADAAGALHAMPRLGGGGGATLVFLDPARRDAHGGRVYGLADCSPDVCAMRDELRDKADVVMLKLSPMLDVDAAVRQLGDVAEVHVVSVDNECKELLVVMRRGAEAPRTCCADIHGGRVEAFSFTQRGGGAPLAAGVAAGDYLYEPNASIMKAGCFGEVGRQTGLEQLDANSHLFVGREWRPDFPGRKFSIRAVTSLNKHELRRALGGLTRANISVRNFPMDVAALRRRLKLREGGDTYLFATTCQGRHLLLVTTRPDAAESQPEGWECRASAPEHNF